jgi:hypothetical protein
MDTIGYFERFRERVGQKFEDGNERTQNILNFQNFFLDILVG